MGERYIKLKINSELFELLKHPDCFVLITQIAVRARYNKTLLETEPLDKYQARIGDYRNIGITEQRYRAAKELLEESGLVTFEATNKGTIATLCNSRVYDISFWVENEQDNEQDNGQTTGKQRTNNEQGNEQDNEQDNEQGNDYNKKDNQKDKKKDKRDNILFAEMIEDLEFKDMDSLRFREKYLEWLLYRREIKHPLTEGAIRADLRHIKTVGPARAWEMMGIAMGSSWRGWIWDGKRDTDGNSLKKTRPDGFVEPTQAY